MNRLLPGICCAFAALHGLVSCQSPSTSRDAEHFFAEHVKPIFERNCLQCHNGQGEMQSKLDLRNRQTALRQPGSKSLVSPGDPDGSLLIKAVSRKGSHPKLMPRLDMSLAAEEIAVLREWIQDGAAWPSGKAGELAARPNPER